MEELNKYCDNIHKNYTSCYDGWLDKYIDLLKNDDVIEMCIRDSFNSADIRFFVFTVVVPRIIVIIDDGVIVVSVRIQAVSYTHLLYCFRGRGFRSPYDYRPLGRCFERKFGDYHCQCKGCMR